MKLVQKIKRSLIHLTPHPFQSRWLTAQVRANLDSAIAKAEKGHSAEIRLVIEKALPMHLAWRFPVRERALDLFSHLRMWDTQARNGVLLYLNLAEKRLEIIADRGISQHISDTTWQQLADEAVTRLYEKHYLMALTILIEKVAKQLRVYYASEDVAGNELPDAVLII